MAEVKFYRCSGYQKRIHGLVPGSNRSVTCTLYTDTETFQDDTRYFVKHKGLYIEVFNWSRGGLVELWCVKVGGVSYAV